MDDRLTRGRFDIRDPIQSTSSGPDPDIFLRAAPWLGRGPSSGKAKFSLTAQSRFGERAFATSDGARGYAPAVHGDEVETLSDGAIVLASNPSDGGASSRDPLRQGAVLGVQYHPELDLGEIAAALDRQAEA